MRGRAAGVRAAKVSPLVQLALSQKLGRRRPGATRPPPSVPTTSEPGAGTGFGKSATSPLARPPFHSQANRPSDDLSPSSPLFKDESIYRAPSPYLHRFRRQLYFLLRRVPPVPRGRPHEKAGRLFHRKMLSYVQILTVPTADTPGACLLLNFENRRYLFGQVSEGLQRVMVQRKIAPRKIEDIFLSGPVGWPMAGGLLGMILTIADIDASARQSLEEENKKKQARGKKNASTPDSTSLNIYGGQNLMHLLASARRFVFRKGLPLVPHEIQGDARSGDNSTSSEPDWQDGNIRVWYIPSAIEASPNLRKRSLSEMLERENGGDGVGNPAPTSAEQQKLAQDLRETIVKQMFNSDWSLDALVEKKLHDVDLPAAVFVRDEKGHLKKYDGPLPGGDIEVPNIQVLVRRPWPGAEVRALPRTRRSTTSMSYIIKSQTRRGKFNAEEAVRLGVAKPDYRKLTQGISVTGKDGLTVTPEMVLDAPVKGHGFVVADLADPTFLDSFLSRPEWSNKDIMDGIEVFYWILHKDSGASGGSGAAYYDRLSAFMKEHSSAKHVVLSGSVSANQLAFESPAAVAVRLHRIDGDRFPLLRAGQEPIEGEDGNPDGLYEAGRPGATLQISPRVVFQDDKVVPYLDFNAPLKEMEPEVLALADAAKERIGSPAFARRIEQEEADIPNRDAEVITLGTGSALPSKYRNVSATLVRVPGRGNYLFDCGENTLGQLRRMYGHSGADEVLRDLRLVWISHLHADHHLGLASIVKRTRVAKLAAGMASPRLAIASHPHLHEWLAEYADIEDIHMSGLDLLEFGTAGKKNMNYTFEEDSASPTGLGKIEACLVDHCKFAMAVALTWPSGLKIAYSGDCRPSDTFIKMAQGATLLVHECTFDDELQGDAIAKKHSTMSEALDVGRRMGARRIILTHFSQRYPKIPIISQAAETEEMDGPVKRDTPPTLFAWDHMRVRLGDFQKAEAFLPAIRKLFEKEDKK